MDGMQLNPAPHSLSSPEGHGGYAGPVDPPVDPPSVASVPEDPLPPDDPVEPLVVGSVVVEPGSVVEDPLVDSEPAVVLCVAPPLLEVLASVLVLPEVVSPEVASPEASLSSPQPDRVKNEPIAAKVNARSFPEGVGRFDGSAR